MNIETIIRTKDKLNAELMEALSKMTLSSRVSEIKQEIQNNQNACPHVSDKYSNILIEGKCPFCGKKIGE